MLTDESCTVGEVLISKTDKTSKIREQPILRTNLNQYSKESYYFVGR